MCASEVNAMTGKHESLEGLVQLPASEVKKRGWRGVMKAVAPSGKVVVTNHDEPEAVILAAEEYLRIMAIVGRVEEEADVALEALRKRFDERLARLQAPEAGDLFRAAMSAPTLGDETLKAGFGF
jgi:PHD/YefM family antitoxin component YafN of YafNO toxin-antitoxin module